MMKYRKVNYLCEFITFIYMIMYNYVSFELSYMWYVISDAKHNPCVFIRETIEYLNDIIL